MTTDLSIIVDSQYHDVIIKSGYTITEFQRRIIETLKLCDGVTADTVCECLLNVYENAETSYMINAMRNTKNIPLTIQQEIVKVFNETIFKKYPIKRFIEYTIGIIENMVIDGVLSDKNREDLYRAITKNSPLVYPAKCYARTFSCSDKYADKH